MLHVKKTVEKLNKLVELAETMEQNSVILSVEEAQAIADELPRILDKSIRRKQAYRALQTAYQELMRVKQKDFVKTALDVIG